MTTGTGHQMADDTTDEFDVVVLCGAMQFYDNLLIRARELTEQGQIVLFPFYVENPSKDWHDTLDAMHQARIMLADYMEVVTDENGYIGDGVKAELKFASENGLPIFYVTFAKENANVIQD
jgi:hypothetical protein